MNIVQREFNTLCKLGGGRGGGPARGKVQELLRTYGKKLTKFGHLEIAEHLGEFAGENPWHVCFAVGLCWGHLAKLDLAFTDAVVSLFKTWNSDDLRVAKSFHMERGPQPIEQSLVGGHMLFERVTLPPKLPNTLKGYGEAQQRILGRVISRDRPKYIGSWNATAMFMIGLFSDEALAKTLLTPEVLLPPGGPLFAGLQTLSNVHFLSRSPAGSELDDEDFESGALYENNALFAEIIRGAPDFNLLDAHSGVYLLGTRHPHADSWIS